MGEIPLKTALPKDQLGHFSVEGYGLFEPV